MGGWSSVGKWNGGERETHYGPVTRPTFIHTQETQQSTINMLLLEEGEGEEEEGEEVMITMMMMMMRVLCQSPAHVNTF